MQSISMEMSSKHFYTKNSYIRTHLIQQQWNVTQLQGG